MISFLKVGWVLAILVAGSLLVMSTAAEEKNAKTLFEARCSMCHSTDKPLGKTKTAQEWRQIVTRMTEHAAGKITAEEKETIIKYLTEIRGK